MYPASFDYHTPASVQEAIALLAKLKDDAKLLAGGHSLIPMMKLRLAQPKHLIDLRKVPNLSGIKEDGNTLVFGAMTTWWQIESSKVVKAKVPVLSETAAMVGDPAVRNLGTIGGSLAHADPAADMPATVIALGAELRRRGREGAPHREGGRLLQGADDDGGRGGRDPRRGPGAGADRRVGADYQKFKHPASRFAVVGVCAVVTVDGKGACSKAGVGVTGAGTHALRAKGVEAGLTGKTLDQATIEAAASKAADGVDVQADLQGSVEYKQHLLRVHARRAIEAARSKKARGGK